MAAKATNNAGAASAIDVPRPVPRAELEAGERWKRALTITVDGPAAADLLLMGPAAWHVDGTALRMTGVSRDITVRKQTEAELAKAKDLAEEAARLKSSARMVEAVDPAVALYEEPPTESLVVETPWADLRVRAADWAEAFDAVDAGTPHNEAQEQVWEALLEILLDGFPDDEVPADDVRRALAGTGVLRRAFRRAWRT